MRRRTASVAITVYLAMCLSFAGLLAPPLAAPAKADPIETITLTVQVTSLQGGNTRPLSLQQGDEIIQFTQNNLIVGSNPTGSLDTVIIVDALVTGNLAGTMTIDTHILSVSWDELPPNTAKGYFVHKLMFDDGAGNTFGGIMLNDYERTGIPPDHVESSDGFVVSTSGTGTFSGQKLIGTMSGIPGGVTLTLRRYSNLDISGPSPFSYSGTLTGFPECIRPLGDSSGPLPNDEFVQFTRPNIDIPASSTDLTYLAKHTSSGTATGALAGTMTQTINSLQIPVGHGWAVGKFNYSDGGGTMSGVLLADTLGGSPIVRSAGYMFALYDAGTTTGAYAGKDYFATFSATFDGSSGPPYVMSGTGDLYTLAEGAGPPLAPTPVPAETTTLIVQGTSFQWGNTRPLSLQQGDEIIQFTRPNLVVGSNPAGSLDTVIIVDALVTGDLTGTMTIDTQVLNVSWDELPPNTSTGYFVHKLMFDDGAGNTFGGIMLNDHDQTGLPPDIIESSNGFVVSTSGTGTFSGQKLIGTMSGIPGGAILTLRRYSNSQISGPLSFSGSGTWVPGGFRPLGPDGTSQPTDEFVQFTRPNINIPANDPANYEELGTSTGMLSGALDGTWNQSYNSVLIGGITPALQGWGVGRFDYSDSVGTIAGIAVWDNIGGGDPSASPSSGYSFALHDWGGATGAYAGKDYFMSAAMVADTSTLQFLNTGNLYALGASQVNTPSGPNIPVDLGNVLVTFENVSGDGTTTITTQQGNPGGPLPPNFRVRGQFIDIVTTATYTGNVTVGIRYAPGTENPQNLKMFHDEGGNWVDVTTWVDTANRIVYGEVSSFSWFFIGGEWVYVAESAPVAPNIYLGIAAAFGAAVLALGIRRRLVRQA